MLENTVSNKCIVYDYIRIGDHVRAIMQNIITIDDVHILKSEYSIWYHLPTGEHYCTCIGNQMGKQQCVHLKAFFKDERIKKIIGEKNE